MNRCVFVLFAVCLGCSSLPEINTGTVSAKTCGVPFLNKEWRLVHSIMATMPTGDISSVLGVTVADPVGLTLQSAILTLEGLVVFNAEYDIKANKKLSITRSIQPFDSPHFARGLMEDIRLILFRPEMDVLRSGTLDDGAKVCRFHSDAGSYVDVIQKAPLRFTINRYSKSQSLERSVLITLMDKDGQLVPLRMELIAKGIFGYKLIMNLVSAEAVQASGRGLGK